jgi:hypothetical protein
MTTLEQPVETLAAKPRLDLYIALSNNMLRLKSGVGQIIRPLAKVVRNLRLAPNALRAR